MQVFMPGERGHKVTSSQAPFFFARGEEFPITLLSRENAFFNMVISIIIMLLSFFCACIYRCNCGFVCMNGFANSKMVRI